MKNVKMFETEFLKDQLDLPWCAVEDNLIETTRWSEIHEIIFEYEGKHYRTSYSCGATEMQDESPWEFEKTVNCVEVEQREVMVTKWVPVEKESQQ